MDVSVAGGGKGLKSSATLEVVLDYTGHLRRLVLTSVELARYQDVDPGVVVVGDQVFDIASTLGDRFLDHHREKKGSGDYPLLHQYEQFEVLLGDHRVTLLFDGRVRQTAVQVGDHLIIFIDQDSEVCGFQFTALTDTQMEEVVDTIRYQSQGTSPTAAETMPDR